VGNVNTHLVEVGGNTSSATALARLGTHHEPDGNSRNEENVKLDHGGKMFWKN